MEGPGGKVALQSIGVASAPQSMNGMTGGIVEPTVRGRKVLFTAIPWACDRLPGNDVEEAFKIARQYQGELRMRCWLRIHLIGLAIALSAALGLTLSLTDGARHGARAQDVSYEVRDALSAYGHWSEDPRWGVVWSPADVSADWRPYEFGHWVYTEEWGWYWVSDEAWGWITYHYGRWSWDADSGWFWIPGDEWGPAWVLWRSGDDIVGWAPMPPDDYVVDDAAAPHFWNFVYAADLVAPSLATVVLPAGQALVFIGQTVFVNPTIVVRANDRVVVANPGVPPAIIAARIGHPLHTVAVEPHVVPGTVGVGGAIVGPPPKGARVQDSVTALTTLIEPVAQIPPPTAYRPGQAILGPNVPKVLQRANMTPPTPPPPLPSEPNRLPLQEAAPASPPPMRPNLGVDRPPPVLPMRPAPPAPSPPRPPIVTSAPHLPPLRAQEPLRRCGLVNGQQVCR
jgi:hypothetical protein